jgi:hypothetical protein
MAVELVQRPAVDFTMTPLLSRRGVFAFGAA